MNDKYQATKPTEISPRARVWTFRHNGPYFGRGEIRDVPESIFTPWALRCGHKLGQILRSIRDYIEILERCDGHFQLILGEDWSPPIFPIIAEILLSCCYLCRVEPKPKNNKFRRMYYPALLKSCADLFVDSVYSLMRYPTGYRVIYSYDYVSTDTIKQILNSINYFKDNERAMLAIQWMITSKHFPSEPGCFPVIQPSVLSKAENYYNTIIKISKGTRGYDDAVYMAFLLMLDASRNDQVGIKPTASNYQLVYRELSGRLRYYSNKLDKTFLLYNKILAINQGSFQDLVAYQNSPSDFKLMDPYRRASLAIYTMLLLRQVGGTILSLIPVELFMEIREHLYLP